MAAMNDPLDSRARIDAHRSVVDTVDDQLVRLLQLRAGSVLEIGAAKRALGLSVRDEARETAILDRIRNTQLAAAGPLDGPALERIYKTIFELMRQLEENHQESRP